MLESVRDELTHDTRVIRSTRTHPSDAMPAKRLFEGSYHCFMHSSK